MPLCKNLQRGTEKPSVHRFFHPDYTVGPGITPDQRRKRAGRGLPAKQVTASGELHPAPKTAFILDYFNNSTF